MRKVRLGLLASALLFLASCAAVPVAEDLDQFQANEIIALLSSQGIASTASRETGARGKYSVTVDRSNYTQAKTILAERGLPSQPRPSFEELVQPRGFLPNSREVDALRLDHALAVEIQDTLSSHPGVSSVKVIVRSRTVTAGQEPSVSVLIQERAGQQLNREEIATIVNRAVPGVKAEQVLITVAEEPRRDKNQTEAGVFQKGGEVVHVPLVPFLFDWRVPEDDYNAMAIVLVICFVILAFIGGLIGYWFGFYHNVKNNPDLALPDLGTRSLRLDRPNRDIPEV